jgi:hypothetical protein
MTSSLELEDEDGFTKIVDLDVPRVDLVDHAANGTSFLLTKSEETADAGLLTTDQVRALAKASTELEEPPVSDPIVKDNLDPTEPLVGDSPAAQSPGSPEWEQVDHDTAQKFISILNFAQYAVTQLAGREAQEGTAGEDDGWDNSWDLEDAACAIQYAIDSLAVYAAGEASDIEIADMEKAAAVVKALQPLADLDIVAAQSAVVVRKSGRVLSTSNETLLRNAVESITKVLASLPVAPETEEPVTKNDAPADEVEKTEDTAPVEPAVETVEKADDTAGDTGDALVVVFPANSSTPLGVVKEGDIIPVKGTGAPEEETPAEADPAAPVDTAAAPAGAVGVAKGEEPAAEVDFTKELADLRALVKSQGEQLEFLGSPARPRAAMNGVTPKGPLPLPEHNRQGDDVAKAAALTDEEVTDLKKTVLSAGTEAERSEARERLNAATTASWRDVREQAAKNYRR